MGARGGPVSAHGEVLGLSGTDWPSGMGRSWRMRTRAVLALVARCRRRLSGRQSSQWENAACRGRTTFYTEESTRATARVVRNHLGARAPAGSSCASISLQGVAGRRNQLSPRQLTRKLPFLALECTTEPCFRRATAQVKFLVNGQDNHCGYLYPWMGTVMEQWGKLRAPPELAEQTVSTVLMQPRSTIKMIVGEGELAMPWLGH